MLRKGFVQQQIEGLGLALATIFGVELSRADVLKRLGASCKNLTGLNLDTLMRLDDGSLLGMFSGGDRTRTAGNAFVAAQFLLQRAKAEPTQARAARRKAFLLYSEAIALEASLRSDDFVTELTALLTDLPDSDRTDLVLRQAARVQEELGAYARAENYHYELRDRAAPGADTDAIAFYERLLGYPDEELNDGELPRDEIETALAELRSEG